MKIYVASKAENYSNVRYLYGLLESDGHTITHDWTKDVEQLGAESMGASVTTSRACAEKDLRGVLEADLLILMPRERICGALIETGIAIGKGIPVLVLGWPLQHTVFFDLEDVTILETEYMEDLDQGILDQVAHFSRNAL